MEGMALVTVNASALGQFSKRRSSGSHYSSGGAFPSVAGSDGVGHTPDGRHVYFVFPEAPCVARGSDVREDGAKHALLGKGLARRMSR